MINITYITLLAALVLPAFAQDTRTLSVHACLKSGEERHYTVTHANGTMEGHSQQSDNGGEPCLPGETDVVFGSVQVGAAKDAMARFSIRMGGEDGGELMRKTVSPT